MRMRESGLFLLCWRQCVMMVFKKSRNSRRKISLSMGRKERNEHYEKFGKVITDSIIQIEGHIYHIECQSEKDGNMAVRMMEYDFAIALELFL